MMTEEGGEQIEHWQKLRDQADRCLQQALKNNSSHVVSRALLSYSRCDQTINTILLRNQNLNKNSN